MYRNTNCRLQAHRGVSTDAPENTLAAFKMAIDLKYDIIELDPKFTKDGEIIVLHDRTLNRTGRIDGKPFDRDNVEVKDFNFRDLCKIDVGEWKGEQWKGERIPRLKDALDFIVSQGMEVKIDNVVQTFPEDMQTKALEIIDAAGGVVGISASDIEYLKRAVEIATYAPVHYDGLVDEAHMDEVKRIAKGHELYVWLRFDNALTSWNKNPPATKEYVQWAKKYGKVGVWILSTEEEMARALEFGADVVETTGGIKP